MSTTKLSVGLVEMPPRAAHLDSQIRVINQNFRQVVDTLNRAIGAGSIVVDGSITEAMLATAAKTLIGDVTGTVGATGSTTVEKIRGKTVTTPVAGDDGKALTYNHGGSSFGYTSLFASPLTTRGDLLTRDASAHVRLAVGAANRVLFSDGTDPSWATVSSVLDVIGSTRGAVLFRGAAGWEILAPGTSGHFLKSNGAGADPSYAAGGGGSTSPLTTKGDIWAYSTLDDRFPVGATNGHVLTVDNTQAFGFKWAAAAGASNALLDGANHTDTVAATVSRGSIIYGNSTPAWDELVLGLTRKVLRSDGTDIKWERPRHLSAAHSKPIDSVFGANTIFNGGHVNAANVGGTQAAAADTARVANKYTQAVANATSGPSAPTSGPLVTPAMSPAFWADFKIVTATLIYVQVGFSSGSIQGTAAKIATTHQAWLAWLAGTDTNFFFRTCNAVTATATDTGVAKDANWHDVLIWTPDAGVTWYCELDGVLVATNTTNVPTTSQILYAACGFTCGTGGTQTGELRTSYMRVQLNHSL